MFCKRGSPPPADPDSEQPKEPSGYSLIMEEAFPFDAAFGFLQLAAVIAHFFFICAVTTGSHWQRYTEVYCGIMNSGAIVFLSLCVFGAGNTYRPNGSDSLRKDPRRHRKMEAAVLCSFIMVLLLSPCAITHVLPMVLCICLSRFALLSAPGAVTGVWLAVATCNSGGTTQKPTEMFGNFQPDRGRLSRPS